MTFTGPSRLGVLICGGGIAGATLACLLARAGHHTTVVERDRTARSSGNPVDVRRPAFDIMEDVGRELDVDDRGVDVTFRRAAPSASTPGRTRHLLRLRQSRQNPYLDQRPGNPPRGRSVLRLPVG